MHQSSFVPWLSFEFFLELRKLSLCSEIRQCMHGPAQIDCMLESWGPVRIRRLYRATCQLGIRAKLRRIDVAVRVLDVLAATTCDLAVVRTQHSLACTLIVVVFS